MPVIVIWMLVTFTSNLDLSLIFSKRIHQSNYFATSFQSEGTETHRVISVDCLLPYFLEFHFLSVSQTANVSFPVSFFWLLPLQIQNLLDPNWPQFISPENLQLFITKDITRNITLYDTQLGTNQMYTFIQHTPWYRL